MTIPQRILLHVAAGAGLVIAVATAVTCGIVYNNAKQRDLKHLATYVSERSRREEIDNLDRYHDRLPPGKRQQLLRSINPSGIWPI